MAHFLSDLPAHGDYPQPTHEKRKSNGVNNFESPEDVEVGL
jgi:hypothetical protein